LAGEGEEDEDTVLEQRGKLYRLQNGKYEVVGLGVFKVKRSKEGGKRRLLLRRDGSGHVILVSS
jgi:nucleoporin NUP2